MSFLFFRYHLYKKSSYCFIINYFCVFYARITFFVVLISKK
ncbi:hypothetical protein FWK35_00039288 [Aphis craccivora]|uniref:Uncharacterized protein n=1 Tax=Aphis craccivora TaxID=307492 RepID=A0A6G0W4W9_APHCR|nr:hypothetical protein FWK35_00039288 [Aphis craccivora]